MGLLASYWFGGFGWLAPMANLVAVPVLGLWVAPLCLLGALLAPLGAATPAWELAALPVAGFLALDGMLDLPAWVSYRPQLPELLAILSAILVLVAHRQLPLRWPLAGLLALVLAGSQGRDTQEGLELWLLDVGQGLSVVVREQGFVMVYDTGAGDPAGPNMASAVLIPFLEQQGIKRIDLLVISHGDRDHASGVFTLHEHFPVGETWYGESAFPGVRRQYPCRAGRHRQFGRLDIEVLAPLAPGAAGNNASCVLRLDSEGFRVLLPGDIETAVEYDLLRRRRARLAAEVLVLAHHGSRSSSSSAFIAAVGPQMVLLSRGYRNRFGHPHGVVMRRLAAFGAVPCDTAEQGAIRLRAREGEFRSLLGWRHKWRYYWAGAASPACVPAYNGAQVQ
jgi:competence protein ComEC